MQLRPLTLDDKSLFDNYVSRMQTHLSSYAFTPLFIWQDHFQFYWTLRHNYISVFAKQGSDYFMPILPIPYAVNNPAYIENVHEIYQFMIEKNRNPQIARIENVPEELLPAFKDEGFTAHRKETEYIYRSKDLSELRGDRYKQQRNTYNAFVARFPAVTSTPYQVADRKACLELYENWRKSRTEKYDDPIYQAMLEDSQTAHLIGITNAEELGLIGRIIRINGRLCAYTFGYRLNSEMFCILFEIADLNIKGLAQFIFREFCKELTKSYQWINTMDDSGLENLRRVKLAYHPKRLLPTYNLNHK